MVGGSTPVRETGPAAKVAAVNGREFAQRLAAELGLPPLDQGAEDALLGMAGVAAHASERLAAPLCTYLAGASGRPVDEVAALVKRLAQS